jgi:hypothetical protein
MTTLIRMHTLARVERDHEKEARLALERMNALAWMQSRPELAALFAADIAAALAAANRDFHAAAAPGAGGAVIDCRSQS